MKRRDANSNTRPDPLDDRAVDIGRYVLSLLCIAAAIGRCFAPEAIANRLDWQFVLLLGAAVALLLLPYLSKVSVSKSGLNLGFGSPRIRRALKDFGVGGKRSSGGGKSVVLKQLAGRLFETLHGVLPATQMNTVEEVLKKSTSDESIGDPQKGQWGGSHERGGYSLEANVEAIRDSPDWFGVHLSVRAGLYWSCVGDESPVPSASNIFDAPRSTSPSNMAWQPWTSWRGVLSRSGRKCLTAKAK